METASEIVRPQTAQDGKGVEKASTLYEANTEKVDKPGSPFRRTTTRKV